MRVRLRLTASLAVLCPVCRYTVFTCFCLAMLGAALWNGAGRYNYYLVDVYAKKLGKAVETSLEAKDYEAQSML